MKIILTQFRISSRRATPDYQHSGDTLLMNVVRRMGCGSVCKQPRTWYTIFGWFGPECMGPLGLFTVSTPCTCLGQPCFVRGVLARTLFQFVGETRCCTVLFGRLGLATDEPYTFKRLPIGKLSYSYHHHGTILTRDRDMCPDPGV